MEDQVSLVEVLFERTGEFTKKSVELYRLKAISKSAEVISNLAMRFAIISIAILFFLVFNIGVALFLGEQLGKDYYGFFSVAGFYAVIGILFYIFRNSWIKEPVRDSVLIQALN
ncbi:MAG: hypothetical protein IPJ32_13405 [Sphingobacteriaceae bacterium]|nr:hypothetical protein [Sphingobacteriaceae bacterium]